MGLKKNSLYSRDIQSRLQVHTPFTPATLPAACPPPPTLSPAPRPPFALLTSAAAQVSLFPLRTSPRPVPSTDDAIEPGGQSPWLPTYGRGDGRREARAARGRRRRRGSRPPPPRFTATAAEGRGRRPPAPGGSSPQATLCTGKLGQGSWFPRHLF